MDIVVYREGLDTLGYQVTPDTLDQVAQVVIQALKDYLDIQEPGESRVILEGLDTQGQKVYLGTQVFPVTQESLVTAEFQEFLDIMELPGIRGFRATLEYMERRATLVLLV